MIESSINSIINNDLQDIAYLFFSDFLERDVAIKHDYKECDGYMINIINIDDKTYQRKDKIEGFDSELIRKRMIKRNAKMLLYDALSCLTNKKMPWGSLTGIRPTRFFYQLLEEGNINPETALRDDFCVSESKMGLLLDTISRQKPLINNSEKDICIYIGIPFCVTKCAFCSFPSALISKAGGFIDDYIKTLVKEIRALKTIIKYNDYRVRAVYIGGGTPTSLTAEQLKIILSECDFDTKEFTVEAGRPDTITKAKLEVMKKFNVNRISVNPQTFNDKTLQLIGRKHTASDVVSCLEMVNNYNFMVNMDLIAGLPNETTEMFDYSLKAACDLKVHNITVHTLALKKGAELKLRGFKGDDKIATEMVDLAYLKLKANGYNPYYMYRQKYMSANLENVGYSLAGSECVYNIDIMEENTNILACGANAISKRIFPSETRLERLAGNKDILTYIANIDKLIENKNKLFKN